MIQHLTTRLWIDWQLSQVSHQDHIMDSVRSVLQPLIHNLPAPIHNLGVSILGKKCYQTLLLDIDIEATDCIKLAASKGLGIGIIAASSIVKIPQLLKLINSKSASGISFLSYLLETSAYLISLAYNARQGFPFSTYGETGLIMVQNVVIAVLVLQYSGRSSIAAAFVAALGASAVTLFSKEILTLDTLSYLQAGAGILGVAAKLPQILTVYKEGGTGQLSAFAVSSFTSSYLVYHWLIMHRSLTISRVPFLGFSQLCRRWMIDWFSMDSLQVLLWTLFWLCRWFIIGMRLLRRWRASRRRRLALLRLPGLQLLRLRARVLQPAGVDRLTIDLYLVF